MTTSSTVFHRYFPVSRPDRDWGLFVTTIGEFRAPPNVSYPPSGHPEGYAFEWRDGRTLDVFTLVYISDGRGEFESRPRFSATIESGQVMLLFPGVWHRYRPDPELGWREHWIGFDGQIARSWLKHKFFSAKSPVLKID